MQAYITCIVTGPGIACDDLRAFLQHGKMCYSDAESRRQTVNLYYAYAIDVVTNLMGKFIEPLSNPCLHSTHSHVSPPPARDAT